jgi:hypothetical protein
MRMNLLHAAILALCVAVPAHADDPWSGKRAAFFGVTFIDSSTEGELRGVRTDEEARIELMRAQIAETLREQGLDLVDLSPVQDELDRTRNPARCNGCELRMAKRLGADYAVVSEVQKVSNLILSMNIYVRDTATGRNLRGQAVDIRSNTDESWLRGARYILRNNIFAPR